MRDSAPQHALDISGIPEPVPRDEPTSTYGNRSPYTVLGKSYRVLDSAEGYVERGMASWYGQKFHGRQTSSRELYDMCSFSAAHKTLPLPSYVRVTNLDNGRSVVVRVNDRGPFHEGRIIDLSYAAAVKLGVDRTGTARVEVQALNGGGARSPPTPPAAAARGALRRRHAARAADRPGGRLSRPGQCAAHRRPAASMRGSTTSQVEHGARWRDGKVWRVRVGPLAAPALEGVLEPDPRAWACPARECSANKV